MTRIEHTDTATTISELALEPLFIELRTLAIHGKHLKPGLLRQFVAEDIIEAAGPTLRGRPLAWHLFHEKHCAALAPHIHVLWQKGMVYRVAQVSSNKLQDERYSEMLAQMEQRGLDLCDLLALILAQDHRFDPEPLRTDYDRARRRELSIGDYTLSLSPNACYSLKCLEDARRQHDRDALAIADEEFNEVIKQAHLLLVHLYDQGIILGHPTLNSDLDDKMILSLPLKSLGAERGKDEAPQPRLRWEWRRGYRERGESAALKNLMQANELALLAAISDLIVQQCLHTLQESAQSLIANLGIVLETEKTHLKVLEGGIASLPVEEALIWKVYEEEEIRLEEYPHAWERLYAQLFALDQVFIDG